MSRESGGVHDRGIAERVQQIWNEEKTHILAIATNVDYFDFSTAPFVQGEIDILKIYHTGRIGLEEVKCTINNKNVEKARRQLMKVKEYFKSYKPEVASYFVDCKTKIPY